MGRLQSSISCQQALKVVPLNNDVLRHAEFVTLAQYEDTVSHGNRVAVAKLNVILHRFPPLETKPTPGRAIP